MTRTTIGATPMASLFVAFALAACNQSVEHAEPAMATRSITQAPAAASSAIASAHGDLLYGRVTTEDGAVREGRLRWGGDQEALWSNYFNGVKSVNPWVVHAPKEHSAISVFGKELFGWDHRPDVGRPFMARFGDIARIELRGRDIQVILKSGTLVHINRNGSDDMSDGVRVWNDTGGFVQLNEWGIRTIEFLPTAEPVAAASPLYGTVRTRAGDFTGLIQWNRRACLRTDELTGRSTGGVRSLRFDTIRSVARHSSDSVLVTLLDGHGEIVLAGTNAVALGGIYVDDPRYGRVLVSFDAFERADFTPVSTGPAYGDYQPGRPLTGDVVTRSGRRISGRLVFDLDESEFPETLDAPSQGVDYMIPFAMIATIVPGDVAYAQRAQLTLLSGDVLHLDRYGDLGERNAGMLIFVAGQDRAEYVPWPEVGRIDFHRPTEKDSRSSPR